MSTLPTSAPTARSGRSSPTAFQSHTTTRTRAGGFARWAPIVGGSALTLFGISRRSRAGLFLGAAGGYLIYHGATATKKPMESVARSSVIIDAPTTEIFRFWRNFENLPTFMRHLENVTDLGNGRSEWIAIGPMGTRVRWTAEIVNEREGEFIAWRSLPDSEVSVDGFVSFSKATGHRGTLVEAMVSFRPPAGAAGRIAAKLMGKEPSFMMRNDLRRLKALLETGEIPTTEGQPHGPRSAVAAIARVADPDRPIRREAKLGEVITAKRRVS
jgi:uncharacterized membrane protein